MRGTQRTRVVEQASKLIVCVVTSDSPRFSVEAFRLGYLTDSSSLVINRSSSGVMGVGALLLKKAKKAIESAQASHL
jgi:hypothetical protein